MKVEDIFLLGSAVLGIAKNSEKIIEILNDGGVHHFSFDFTLQYSMNNGTSIGNLEFYHTGKNNFKNS